MDYFDCYKEPCSKEASLTAEPMWLCVVKQNMKYLIHGSQRWLQSNRTWENKSETSRWASLNLPMPYRPLEDTASCTCPFLFLCRSSNIKLGKNLREICPGYRLVSAKHYIFHYIKALWTLHFCMRCDLWNTIYFFKIWRSTGRGIICLPKINWNHNSQSPIRMSFLCLTTKLK